MSIAGVTFGLADLALVLVVTFLAVGTAYLPSPRAKSICFWSAWGVMIPVSLAMIVLLPAKPESHHKSPLPVLLKTLLIFMMVLFVVLAKSHMRGFITSFPYVTSFAVYESRHILYTLARRMPTFIISFLPVLLLCRCLPEHVGFTGALVASWGCFIPLFILMDRFYTRRDNPVLQSFAEENGEEFKQQLMDKLPPKI